MVAEADLVESAVEVAVIVAVSAPVLAGLKVMPVPEATPVVELKVPSAIGLTAMFTVFANAPVPETVGVQIAVCVVEIDVGAHTSVTPVIVGDTAVTVCSLIRKCLCIPGRRSWRCRFAVRPGWREHSAGSIVPPVAVQLRRSCRRRYPTQLLRRSRFAPW